MIVATGSSFHNCFKKSDHHTTQSTTMETLDQDVENIFNHIDPELQDAMRRSEEEFLLQQQEEAALREIMERSLAEHHRMARETSEDARAIQLAVQRSAEEEAERQRQRLLETMTRGTIECPPSLTDFVKTNRFFIQRELGVGIRLAHSTSDITITAQSNSALEIARLELQALLHASDSDRHPLRMKIESLKRENVHVFVDNSNIYLGAQLTPGTEGQSNRDFSVRLKVSALAGAVVNSRCCRNRVVFGSKPPANNAVWTKWRDAGFRVHAFDRVPNRGEVLVDDGLLSMINEAIAQHSGQSHTLVLLTGDGNDNHGRASFAKSVELALRHGWKVEVWAWKLSTNSKYRDMQTAYANYGSFSLNYLDEFRDHITFQQATTPAIVAAGTGSARFQPRPSAGPPPRGSPTRTGPLGNNNGRPRRPFDEHWRQPVAVAAPAPAVSADDANDIIEADPMMVAVTLDIHINGTDSDDDLGYDEDKFMCPIGMDVFEDPVRTPYGHYFERAQIEAWISDHHDCPLTRHPLTVGELLPPEEEFLQSLATFRASR